MLYVYNYPQATIMFAGILPLKAWVFGVLMVLGNLMGTSRYVAYDIHLVGIACATAYFFGNLNLGFMEKRGRQHARDVQTQTEAARPSRGR